MQASKILSALIAQTRGRLERILALHGACSVLLVAVLWLLGAYALDRTLELPAAIRLFHLGLLVLLPALAFRREWWRPWRARPNEDGLAILIERAHPQLSSVLVSAIQLEKQPDGSPELIAATVKQAEQAAQRIDLGTVFDARPARRRLSWLALTLLVSMGVVWADPEGVRIFAARMNGAEVAWPRRTQLEMELRAGVPVDPAQPLTVRVARGTDVPIVVRAKGETPDEVELIWSDGRRQTLAATARGEFSALLRGVSADVELWARGGDDQDEQPRAKLLVMVPPDITSMAVVVEPPAYAQLAGSIVRDGDAKVLQGSRVTVHVRTDPPETTGFARLEPEGREIALESTAFPVTEGEPAVLGLSFSFIADKTTRFRFGLTDADGLQNPDPGLYGIDVLEDRAPRVDVWSPARSDYDTTSQGWLIIRARAEDDFGLRSLLLQSQPLQGEVVQRTLTPVVLDPNSVAAERGAAEAPRALWLAQERLPTAALFAAPASTVSTNESNPVATAVAAGSATDIQIVARDVREPEGRETRSTPIRVRVLSDDEFLRRVQDRLARAQTSATALADVLRTKDSELRELEAALAASAAWSEDSAAVSAAAAGARRVQGDARSLSRELTGTAEALLLARVEDRSDAALPLLDAALLDAAQQASTSDARSIQAQLWQDLDELVRQGQLGNGLGPKLIEIATLSVTISETHANAAASALREAEDATAREQAQRLLITAAAAHRRALEDTERLLAKLAEWDTLQSVLNLTRDILEAQKNLSERTKQAAQDR